MKAPALLFVCGVLLQIAAVHAQTLPPTLLSPANGATGQPLNPSLSWSASSGATRYHLQVSPDSNFASFISNDSILTTTSKQVGPLAVLTTYFWRVRARDSSSSYGAFSSPFRFRTTGPPRIPQNLQADPGDREVSLTWDPNTETDFSHYKIYLSATTLLDTVRGVSNSRTTITGLTNGTSYTFTVTAVNTAQQESDFSNAASAMPNRFTELSASLIGGANSSAAWGDYDNDGDLDILINAGGGSAKVYRNEAGKFVDISTGLIGIFFGEVSWGDYDNDGDLDILILGSTLQGAPVAKLYRNDSGRFVDIQTSLPGIGTGSVSWGDYDNDGDLDVLLTGGIAAIYRNDEGEFVNSRVSLPSVFMSAAAWGDYDNDGDLDILLTGWNGNNISKIYRNDEERFVDGGASLLAVNRSTVAWGDYDNDGDLDILLAGLDDLDVFRAKVYRNHRGNFVDVGAGLSGIKEGSVAWGDFDNDGDLDVLLTGNSLPTFPPFVIAKIYRNDAGNFVDIQEPLTGVYQSSTAWGDYDNDGDLDILLIGHNGTSISKIYRNNVRTSNTAPAAPTALSSSVTGGSASLSWDRSTDAQTGSNGLTYNLRIGLTPGGTQIVSPMADVNTGYRRLPQMGNTHLDNSWYIKDLAPGTYYWSVQAIDNAFAGSAFAPEQSFTISGAGRVLAINDAIAAPGETLAIPIRVTDASSIAGAELKITFNPNLLTALDAQTTTLTSGFTLDDTITSGKVAIVLARAAGITSGSGDFVNLVFRVNPNAALGASTTLTFTHVALYDENTQAIPVSTVNGVFRVSSAPQLASLALSPDSVIVELDSVQVFIAVGRDGGGNPITINPTWSLSGDIGKLDPLVGDTTTFTAKKYGEGFISVRQGALVDSTALAVRLRCDINNDALIDVRDVIICLRMMVGLPLPPLPPGHTAPTPYELWAADANRNRTVNMDDAYLILLKAIGRLLPKALAQGSRNAVALGLSTREMQNEEIVIPITVQGGAAIHAASLTLLYDAAALTFEEIAPSVENSFWIANTNENGKIRVALLHADGLLDAQRELLRLRFKVVQAGSAHIPFSIAQAELFDVHAQAVEVLLTQEELSSPPHSFALLQNYPNPFNPETTIRFDLPHPSEVRLQIYNVHGQLLRTLFEGALKLGAWQRTWDGKDARGNEVPSGVYFYRLQVNGGEWSSARKMILMR